MDTYSFQFHYRNVVTCVTAYPIILVDDDPDTLRFISLVLSKADLPIAAAIQDSREVITTLERYHPAVLLLDLGMPHLSGQDILEMVSTHHPETAVLVLTASQDLDTVVSCMKSGAFDYLAKPVNPARLLVSVHNALGMLGLRHQMNSLKSSILHGEYRATGAFSQVITVCRRMNAIFRYIEAISSSREPVLVLGETGVGKELIAHAIHLAGGGRGEFVSINIAGLDDTLFSDTLFGHRKGAFTGAINDRMGLIAKAEGGTVFLDEIGELSPPSQVKLLRVLQDRQYYPLGADGPLRCHVRFVMATNRNLKAMIATNMFREDLYYRLSTHEVTVPPLRERPEDIPLLVEHFVAEACQAMEKRMPSLSAELFPLLQNYDFPGNVRELRALIYNAIAQNHTRTLSLQTFRTALESKRPAGEKPMSERTDGNPLLVVPSRFPTLREAEMLLIEEALRRSRGNQGTAAVLLGLSRQALNRRLARHYSASRSAEDAD